MRTRNVALEEPLEREIDPELEKELQKHPGQWVAITRSTLIATGDSPAEVLREARRLGFDTPILYRVPEAEETVYFF